MLSRSGAIGGFSCRRGWVAGVLSAAIIVLCSAPLSPAEGDARSVGPDREGGYSSSQVLVKITPGLARTLKPALPDKKRGNAAAAPGEVDRAQLSIRLRRTLDGWGALTIRPFYPEPFGDPVLAAKLGLDRYYVIDVPHGTDTPAMAAALAGHPLEVEEAGADGVASVADGVFPMDPDFDRQWSMHNTGVRNTGPSNDSCADNVDWCEDVDIDAPEAWKIHQGTNNVTVAIVDSGVYPHLEFSGRLLIGRNTVISNCVGGSNHGMQCTSNAQCPAGQCNPITDTNDTCPHGTHVAGIVAAAINDEVPCQVLCPTPQNPNQTCDGFCGVAGVNGGARILPVKVLPNCGGSTSDVAEGIIYSADRGADVINLSLQFYLTPGSASSIVLENAVNYAYRRGALLIAAAGNGNPGIVAYPAVLPNCMAVSATNQCDMLATVANSGWNSNYGAAVDLAAPGDDIYSTWTNHSYRCLHGTSMAAPHVTGLASLIKSYIPQMTNVSLERIMTSSAVDLGDPGWDIFYGHGRINALAAMELAQTWPLIIERDPPDLAIDARRPHPPDDSLAREGWLFLEVTFHGDISGLTSEDFVVTQDDGIATATLVKEVIATGENRVGLELDDVIDVGAWTTVMHTMSGSSATLGFLPGDVDGNNGVRDPQDVDALVRALAGEAVFPEWSVDINRSGQLTPADLIELIDLMIGAGEYDAYLGQSLPVIP